MLTTCTFAGRKFKYVRMYRKPIGNFPGYVEMRDVATDVIVRARADMVMISR